MALEEDEHSVLHAAWQAVCSMNIQGWIGVTLVEQQQDVICRQAIGPSAAAKAVMSSGQRLLQLLHTGQCGLSPAQTWWCYVLLWILWSVTLVSWKFTVQCAPFHSHWECWHPSHRRAICARSSFRPTQHVGSRLLDLCV